MAKATRVTECGHQPHYSSGKCRKCYNAAYYAANAERERQRAQARRDADPEANRQSKREWYAANRERVREQQKVTYLKFREKRLAEGKVYAAENAEAKRQATKAWREANPERAREANRRWQREHPEYASVAVFKRRALKRSQTADLTATQWDAILAEFAGHCAYCDRDDLPLVMEHMVPLSRGGAHTAANVVPACAPCNGSKYTKTAREFAGWTVPPRRLNNGAVG